VAAVGTLPEALTFRKTSVIFWGPDTKELSNSRPLGKRLAPPPAAAPGNAYAKLAVTESPLLRIGEVEGS